jgi:hypothetical protein
MGYLYKIIVIKYLVNCIIFINGSNKFNISREAEVKLYFIK